MLPEFLEHFLDIQITKTRVEKDGKEMNDSTQRLSKVMAKAGIASRRACEEIIFAGRVKVNGQTVLLPQTQVSENDNVVVDGNAMSKAERKVYYILHKPINYVCSTRGNSQTKLVLSLFEEVDERLFTVGRLDKDTSGLLLVTNDGHFANRVIHPSAMIEKEYLVKTDEEISPEHLFAISNGTLVEGAYVKPISVTKVRRGTLKIVIGEGKKREVRMLLEAAGLKTEELVRIRIGGLLLGNIPTGQWREMSEREKELIFE